MHCTPGCALGGKAAQQPLHELIHLPLEFCKCSAAALLVHLLPPYPKCAQTLEGPALLAGPSAAGLAAQQPLHQLLLLAARGWQVSRAQQLQQLRDGLGAQLLAAQVGARRAAAGLALGCAQSGGRQNTCRALLLDLPSLTNLLSPPAASAASLSTFS